MLMGPMGPMGPYCGDVVNSLPIREAFKFCFYHLFVSALLFLCVLFVMPGEGYVK